MSGIESVRKAVYSTIVRTGRGPSILELAELTGRSASQIQRDLHELARAHALVLTPSGDAVRMAHPFSTAPMGFVVAPLYGHDDRLWWGGCAWDSFGMSAAMALDVLITTSCPGCGRRHELEAGPEQPPDGDAVVHFMLPAARWWDDVVSTCSNIRLFCTDEHVRAWAQQSTSTIGAVVPVETVWRLAQPWYGDRLRDDFVPHSTEFNQQLLADVGLVGDFWTLR